MPTTIDPKAAWHTLATDAQERLGAAAIAHTLGLIGTMEGLAPHQGYEAAHIEGIRLLVEELRFSLPDAFVDELPRRPNLTDLGIPSCRICGCTDAHACPDACSWVAEDVCSTCEDVAGGSDAPQSI